MAVTDIFQDVFSRLLPTVKRAPKVQNSASQTFNPNSTAAIGLPAFRDHLNDLSTARLSETSRVLLRRLFKHDSDISAAVGAYLTMADVEPIIMGYDEDGVLNRDIIQFALKTLTALFMPYDYSKGYSSLSTLEMFQQELRYMTLLRGSIGIELVLDKAFLPQKVVQVDMSSIEWNEPESGNYKPTQITTNGARVSLDIPTFFTAYHRRDPTTPYAESDFVSAINTIAARQQVINDLYRIMTLVGYPRIHIQVLEEVVRKNMPRNIQNDPVAAREYMDSYLSSISNNFASIRADQPIVNWNSMEVKILNDDNPAAGLQIKEIIDTLNAQNQAATKTVSTVLGRGQSNINTASVESRLFVRNADQINLPLAQVLSQMLTFCLHLSGTPGYIKVKYPSAEMRPDLELEPNRVVKAARLKQDLSLGIITDEEYTMMMYQRPPLATAPVLSGTNFQSVGDAPSVDTSNISPNQGSLQRDLTPDGTEMARSNEVNQDTNAVDPQS